MRKPSIAIVLTAALSAALLAVGAARAEDVTGAPIEESLAAAKGRLNLTPDQEAKLAPLMRENAEKTRAIMAKYGTTPTPEERQAKYDALTSQRRDFRAKLSGVLTDEQLTEWDKMRAEALTRAQKERLRD